MLNTVGDKIVTITDVISTANLSREVEELLQSLTQGLSLNMESAQKLIKIIKHNNLEAPLRIKCIQLYNNDADSTQYRIELNNILQFIYSSECPSQAVDDFVESFRKTLVS